VEFLDSWLGNVAGRFKIVIEQYLQLLVPTINKLLDRIPHKIYFPGTPIHLDLGFATNIQCKDRSHLYLPLAIEVQSDKDPFTEPNLAVFPNYTNSSYDMEVAVSEYFIDGLLFELHKSGLIDIDTEKLLDGRLNVGLVAFGSGGDFDAFDSDAPCKIILKSLDPYPRLEINPVNS